jgi:hypothetical protein
MCWNIEATTSFSLIYLCFIVFYYKMGMKYYKQYILFNCFYLVMEVFQTLQWLFGNVSNTTETCTIINKTFTYIAFILIWAQPLLFSIIGITSDNNNNIFRKLSLLNILVFLYACAVLYYVTELNVQYGYNFEKSSVSNITCTVVGANHHLAWMFQTGLIDYQANHLLYMVLCFVTFIFYQPSMRGIPLGWIMTLVITLCVFKTESNEIASTWCLFSIFSNIVIIMYHILHNNNVNIKQELSPKHA